MRSRIIDRALALAIAINISVYVTAQSSATTQNMSLLFRSGPSRM